MGAKPTAAQVAPITCTPLVAPVSAAPATTSVGFSLLGAATTATATTSSTTAPAAPAPTPAAPAVASLTFRQLEESINKWAVDLDEQEKMFLNQAALVANWDRLLVTNGEKIVSLSETVDRVKK